MKKGWILLVTIFLITVPVQAMEFTAPTAPSEAQKLLPEDPTSFSEGLWFVVRTAMKTLYPSVKEASGICMSLLGVSILTGMLRSLSDDANSISDLAGTSVCGILLFQPTNAMIQLGTRTVEQISQYGRLLLPVMTGALAAQGAVTKSGALYTATALFDALLSSAISGLLVPLVYVFVCICISYRLFGHEILDTASKFIKWMLTWGLKIVLYVFTGYISITGVVGGTTDAALLKATKLTISGMVPVVGGILSDASEAILVSAGLMKNAAGIYGMLAVAALWIGPFLQIGVQYLMLNFTAGLCGMFTPKQFTGLMKDFSTAMGIVLAMTFAVCLMFMISTICFMKGVSN